MPSAFREIKRQRLAEVIMLVGGKTHHYQDKVTEELCHITLAEGL